MKLFTNFNEEVIQLLKSGAVGVIPTDTVYGVVACLDNEVAVRRICSLKKRPVDKPVGTIIISSPEQLDGIVDVELFKAARQFWPGTSVVLPVRGTFEYAHKGLNSLPFRIPTYDNLRKLLEQTGPLATSSANKADETTAGTVHEAIKIFGEKVDFYVDGGDLSSRRASKIVRIEPDGSVSTIRE